MKKVILSLATFAMIAGTTTTMTSCGSDDDTTNTGGGTNDNTGGGTDDNTGGGTDDNTGGGTDDNAGGGTDDNAGGGTDDGVTESDSKLTYNGVEYKLDTTKYGVYGTSEGSVKIFDYVVGEDTIKATKWNVATFNGDLGNLMTSENYIGMTVFVPLNGQETVDLQDSEINYVDKVALYAGNADAPIDLGEVTNKTLNIGSLTPQENENTAGEINYTSEIVTANGNISINVTNADAWGPYLFGEQSSKGASNTRPSSNKLIKTTDKN